MDFATFVFILVGSAALAFLWLYFAETRINDRLKKELKKTRDERCRIQSDYTILRDSFSAAKEKLDDISEYHDSIPDDCIRGQYCEACEFGKIYHTRSALISKTFAVCTKGKSCSNFIQKKENE